jgi:hypothetical protein
MQNSVGARVPVLYLGLLAFLQLLSAGGRLSIPQGAYMGGASLFAVFAEWVTLLPARSDRQRGASQRVKGSASGGNGAAHLRKF